MDAKHPAPTELGSILFRLSYKHLAPNGAQSVPLKFLYLRFTIYDLR